MASNQRGRSSFWIKGLVPGVLISLGLLHSIVGFSAGWKVIVDIAGSRFWNTIHTSDVPLSRPLLLWFLVSGFMLIILGHLAFWVERRIRRPLPAFFGLELLAFSIVVGVVSGGGLPSVLFAGAAIYVIVVARKGMKHTAKEDEAT
ncbi:MAG: DUF6463 family protein [Blastocatellia bacterium]|nr:DUF6463 family protein [Blastocatellia bacterium]